MKKFMLFAAVACVTLSSCVNEDEMVVAGESAAIKFDSPVLKNSRANVTGEIESNLYPTAETFNVFCKIYKDSYAGWTASTNVANYFNAAGDVASHNAAAGSASNFWATANTYYWPDAGYNLAFAAYSPAVFTTAPTSITRTDAGLQIEGFQTETVSDKQYDVMYTSTVYDRNKTNNGSQAVSLVFKHALSSIVFSSQKANTDVDYKITDIILTGEFYTKGNFNQGVNGTVTGGVYAETESPVWTLTDKSNVNYQPTFTAFNVPQATPEIFTAGPAAILPIPQDVPADATVQVSYQKTASGTTTDHVVSIKLTDFRTAENNAINTWETGKRYVYRIAFGQNNQIYFEPTVEPWVTQPTLIYTIN